MIIKGGKCMASANPSHLPCPKYRTKYQGRNMCGYRAIRNIYNWSVSPLIKGDKGDLKAPNKKQDRTILFSFFWTIEHILNTYTYILASAALTTHNNKNPMLNDTIRLTSNKMILFIPITKKIKNLSIYTIRVREDFVKKLVWQVL